jgi:hypothetical protein
MNRKSWIAFYALLNDFTKGATNQYLQFLPEDIQGELESYQIYEEGALKLFPNPSELVKKIHYSWLANTFKDLSDEVFPLYMSTLSKEQLAGLEKLLKKEWKKVELTPFGENFILTNIYKKYIKEQESLPVAVLPQSGLNKLLNFDKRQVISLIDFFGLAELAVEIKDLNKDYIVDKIYACLPIDKKQYLEKCVEGVGGVALSSFQIDKWDGDKEKLAILLHQKGLMRMAISLSAQDTSMVWHVCHKLDTGRAEVIQKYVKEEKEPEDIAALGSQLQELLERFQEDPLTEPQA